MSTTEAQAAVMQSTAARFDEVNQSLQGMLRRLMTELEVLQAQWRGAGGRSFEQVKQAWAVDQEAMHRALAETATAIRSAGRQYSVSDGEAANRLGGVRPGLRLPL